MTESAQPFADVADDARVSETPLVAKGFALRPLTCIYIFMASPLLSSNLSDPNGHRRDRRTRPR